MLSYFPNSDVRTISQIAGKNEHKAHLNFTVVKIGGLYKYRFFNSIVLSEYGDFFPLLSSPIKMSNIVY